MGTNNGEIIIIIENVFVILVEQNRQPCSRKLQKTLTNQGFEILKLSETENPVYAVKFAENEHAVICFLKI